MKGFDGDSPTKPFGGDDDFTITPDSKSVAFSAKVAGKDESWTTNYDLWGAPLDGSAKLRNMTAGQQGLGHQPGVLARRQADVAYRAMKRPGFEADRFGDHDLGRRRPRRNANWRPPGIARPSPSPGAGRQDDLRDWPGRRPGKLFAIDVKTGKVTALTGDGHVTAFDVGPAGHRLRRRQPEGPAQLFSLSAKKAGKPRSS
jgi:hypothetical protein